MRTSPWRLAGSMTGETCQIVPGEAAAKPDRGDRRRHARSERAAKSCCDSEARISISPPRARRNSPPAPPLTTCPTSTLRDRISPALGARMSSRPIRARLAPSVRLGDPHPGIGGIARGALAVEVGLADEAAPDQRLAALEFVLRERGIGARDAGSAPRAESASWP